MYILNPTFIKKLTLFRQKSMLIPGVKCFYCCGFKKEIGIMSPKVIQIKSKNQQSLAYTAIKVGFNS